MGDPLFDVYVMHKCNSWGAAGCDFSPAFQATAEKKSAKKARKVTPRLPFAPLFLQPPPPPWPCPVCLL